MGKLSHSISQPVNFLVSRIRPTDKCSFQLPLLVLPELSHNTKTELIELIHGLLWILAAHELHIPKCLSQANQSVLRESVLVMLHELPLELPVMAWLVWRPVLFDVPVLRVAHPM